MENEVLSILKELQPTFEFEEGVDFIASGYLDSFDIVTLVAGLEEKYGVAISALDIIPENFSSVQNICGLVNNSSKKNG